MGSRLSILGAFPDPSWISALSNFQAVISQHYFFNETLGVAGPKLWCDVCGTRFVED